MLLSKNFRHRQFPACRMQSFLEQGFPVINPDGVLIHRPMADIGFAVPNPMRFLRQGPMGVGFQYHGDGNAESD
jgi:hypothetical protein